MIKKILLPIYLLLITFSTNEAAGPTVNCEGLPGCKGDEVTLGQNSGLLFIVNGITIFIQFIAVIAVFALIFSGVLYLISMGDEEKTNTAKKWIIYSLVGVLVSVSAWGIINLLNNFSIG